ncbi:Putative protein of unknown function [Podospora comata]|uniref:Uncharacterized protein n=1 Tax=Podospora comata TaxID=48703 RepID=A0ABY6SH03_PODCO|nr:Putative protein of unknown function [Podospora comata]
MQLLAPVLFVTATLAAASTEQQPFRRQVGSNSTLVVMQAAETGAFRTGTPRPTDGLGAGRFAGASGSGFEVSGAPSSTFTAIGGLLGVVGAVVGGVMLL